MKAHINNIIELTIRLLQDSSDFERAMIADSYYPTSMQVIGVRNPDIHRIAKEISGEIKEWDPRDVTELARQLTRTGIFECQQVSCSLLDKHKKAFAVLTGDDITFMAVGLDNWVSVDMFGTWIAGVAWHKGIISDSTVEKWLSSENKWERRLAIVSTVSLNLKSRGGSGDPERTLRICRKAMHDREDIIVKAVSWALRELSKRDPSVVFEFLERNKDSLAPKVIREVRQKIQTGTKSGK